MAIVKPHVSIHVSSLQEGVSFYRKLFAIEPSKIRQAYAKCLALRHFEHGQAIGDIIDDGIVEGRPRAIIVVAEAVPVLLFASLRRRG